MLIFTRTEPFNILVKHLTHLTHLTHLSSIQIRMILLNISAQAEQNVRSPANVLMVSSEQKHILVSEWDVIITRVQAWWTVATWDWRGCPLIFLTIQSSCEKKYPDKNKPCSKNISPFSGDLRIIRSLRLGRTHFRPQSNWRECKSWANEWDCSRGGRSITFDEREQISAVRFLCWNYFNSVLFLEICHETSWGMSQLRPSPIIRSSPRCKCSNKMLKLSSNALSV